MLIDTILCGECSQVMRETISDSCIDLTITSPPYDALRDYHGYVFDFEAIAGQLYRVTKQGGVVVWVVGDQTVNGSESGTSFRQALHFMEIGFNLHDTMIYQTAKPPLTHNRYEQKFEYMFVFSKKTPHTFNPIMVPCKYARTYPRSTFRQNATGRQERAHSQKQVNYTKIKGNVWLIKSGNKKGTKDDYAFAHPATFPESLARDHILSWSNPGDLVLDPMCGSGTTCKMAKETGRHYLGIDISQEYVDLARKRVANAKTPLFTL